MRTVKEVSELTGVSVRTLHHYDNIQLLTPTKVTKAGYRLYDDAAMKRLHMILLFRELQFPLKDIKEILDSPDFDQEEAMDQQIQLLELQQQHICQLIVLAKEIKRKGVNDMSFDIFRNHELEQYKKEAKDRWGNTKAYQEYEKKEQNRKNGNQAVKDFMKLFEQVGALKGYNPEDDAVQKKISEIQNFITENYYTCTKGVLKGLGSMYVGDERFKKNIDQAGGEGTAEFVKSAIDKYCE